MKGVTHLPSPAIFPLLLSSPSCEFIQMVWKAITHLPGEESQQGCWDAGRIRSPATCTAEGGEGREEADAGFWPLVKVAHSSAAQEL